MDSDKPDPRHERVRFGRGDMMPDETEWSPLRECSQCGAARPLYRLSMFIPAGFVCDACNPRSDEWGWVKVKSER